MQNNKRTIFFVSLPKSGTDYTWNTLINMTGMKFPKFLSSRGIKKIETGYYENYGKYHSTGDFNTQTMNVRGTKKCVGKGYVFGTHMAASFYNLTVLKKSKIKRVSVIFRNPLDAVVSWTYHLRRVGSHIRNYNSIFQYLPVDYFALDHKSQLSFNVRTFLPAAVNWVESWLGALVEEKTNLNIKICYFDHMRADAVSYFENILNYNQIKYFDMSLIPDKTTQHHFRKGVNNQWIEEFASDDKKFAELLVGNRIKNAFENAVDKYMPFRNAQKAELSGNIELALKNYIEAFMQIPIQKTLQPILVIIKKLNPSYCSEINEVCEQNQAQIEDYYSYPVELVKLICTKYLK